MTRTLKPKTFEKTYAKWGYIFAIPFFAVYIIFSLYPLIYTALLSVSDMRGFASNTLNITGFSTYIKMATNKNFWRTFGNTFSIFGISYIIQFSLGLIIAQILCSAKMRIKGVGFWKYVVYLPAMLTSAAIGMFYRSIFMYPGGFVNNLLKTLGILEKDFRFMGNATFVKGLFVFLITWKDWGYGMLVTMAAIQSINPELYEAAEIDGANGIQSFFGITLPSIKSVELFLAVAGIAGGLQLYDIPHIIGTKRNSRTIMQYIISTGFSGDCRYNEAAAGAMILFFVIVIINVVIMRIVNRNDEDRRFGI